MTIRLMRIACWITKTRNTHSEYVILYLLLFGGNNGYANAPHCYVIRALPVLLRKYNIVLRSPCVNVYTGEGSRVT